MVPDNIVLNVYSSHILCVQLPITVVNINAMHSLSGLLAFSPHTLRDLSVPIACEFVLMPIVD